jgi:hypothetical protein
VVSPCPPWLTPLTSATLRSSRITPGAPRHGRFASERAGRLCAQRCATRWLGAARPTSRLAHFGSHCWLAFVHCPGPASPRPVSLLAARSNPATLRPRYLLSSPSSHSARTHPARASRSRTSDGPRRGAPRAVPRRVPLDLNRGMPMTRARTASARASRSLRR